MVYDLKYIFYRNVLFLYSSHCVRAKREETHLPPARRSPVALTAPREYVFAELRLCASPTRYFCLAWSTQRAIPPALSHMKHLSF